MARRQKLSQPGNLVACRPDMQGDELILWSSHDCEVEEVNGYVHNDNVLLILEVRPPAKTNEPLMLEWEKGAYKVLSPTGVCGWIGAGWVIPVT